MCVLFVFFNQKTAYEMRISDWSSDVCSSDLTRLGLLPLDGEAAAASPEACRLRRLPAVGDARRGDRRAARLRAVLQARLLPREPLGGAVPVARRHVVPRRAARGAGGHRPLRAQPRRDRKSVVSGKSVDGRVSLGGRRIIKKKNTNNTHTT